jgi:3-hydroxybutyryl-CoA dehydrogenase
MSQSGQDKSGSTKARVAKLYIVGESPMVEEYAELFASKGYEVAIAWNAPPDESPKFTSAHIKPSTSIAANVSLAIELTNTDKERKKQNVEKLDKALPPTAPILTSSVTVSATEQCSWIRHKHRLVGIGALPTFIDKPLVEVAPTVFSPKETLEIVSRFYASVGKGIELVQDRVGMVLPRILCQLMNESIFAISEDIADPKDIDTAMKLGANHPNGPIEWAEQIGIRQVYAVLTALQDDLNEDRYRVSPLLRQMALSGEWWKHQ